MRHLRALADYWPLIIQLTALGLVCYGVSLFNVGASLILGGVGLIAGVQFAGSPDDGTTDAVRKARATR